MNIIVPIKHVAETTVRPKIAADGKSVDLAQVKMVVNPFDEFAIEAALVLREKAGSGDVTVVTVGEEDASQSLRTGIAMGATRAARIKSEEARGSDVRAVASLLAAWIKSQQCDLVLCGKHAVGGDNNAVPQMLAVMLGLPFVTSAARMEIDGGVATVHRQIEGKTEVVTVGLPAVISVDKGLNEPRYPTLKGIMASKKAAIEEVSATGLGVDGALLGDAGAALELVRIELPPAKSEGTIIQIGDDPDGAAQQFVDWLKNEAKVI